MEDYVLEWIASRWNGYFVWKGLYDNGNEGCALEGILRMEWRTMSWNGSLRDGMDTSYGRDYTTMEMRAAPWKGFFEWNGNYVWN
jgi:hypothetical protein